MLTTFVTAPRVYYTPAMGDRAWHTEAGRRKRVQIMGDPYWSPHDGVDVVVCAFVDEQMARFEVPVTELSSADAAWDRVPALVALRNTRAYLGGRTTDAPLAQRAVAAPVADNDEPDISSVTIARNRLTETQRANLDLAEQLGRSIRKADQLQARELVREVFQAVASGAIRSDRDRRIAELRVLEEGRGAVLDFAAGGAIRLSGRDGLESLLDTNAITITEHAAGMRYRSYFERAGRLAAIKSAMAQRSGVVRLPAMTESEIFDPRTVQAVVSRAERGEGVKSIDKTVYASIFGNPEEGPRVAQEAIAMLWAIAGSGHTLYSLAPSGRKNQRYSHAIKVGLGALAEHFGMW